MIEFQKELVERLYRKMIALMEEGVSSDDQTVMAKTTKARTDK